MWNQQLETEKQWQDALENESNEYEHHILTMTTQVLAASNYFNEVYVGGNGTEMLIQVLAAPGDGGSVDVIASVLKSGDDDVLVCHTVRGDEVKKLIASYIKHYPNQTLSIDIDGEFFQIRCRLQGDPSTEGLLNATRIRHLQNLDPTDNLKLEIYAPKKNRPKYNPEEERAAIQRPRLAIA